MNNVVFSCLHPVRKHESFEQLIALDHAPSRFFPKEVAFNSFPCLILRLLIDNLDEDLLNFE